MEGITYADYKYVESVCEDFRIQNLGEYQDQYVQRDTLLLVDVFENFDNKCIKIYDLDPIYFLLPPGLISTAIMFEEGRTRTELVNLLIMVAKDIRGGMCHAIINMQR